MNSKSKIKRTLSQKNTQTSFTKSTQQCKITQKSPQISKLTQKRGKIVGFPFFRFISVYFFFFQIFCNIYKV